MNRTRKITEEIARNMIELDRTRAVIQRTPGWLTTEKQEAIEAAEVEAKEREVELYKELREAQFEELAQREVNVQRRVEAKRQSGNYDEL